MGQDSHHLLQLTPGRIRATGGQIVRRESNATPMHSTVPSQNMSGRRIGAERSFARSHTPSSRPSPVTVCLERSNSSLSLSLSRAILQPVHPAHALPYTDVSRPSQIRSDRSAKCPCLMSTEPARPCWIPAHRTRWATHCPVSDRHTVRPLPSSCHTLGFVSFFTTLSIHSTRVSVLPIHPSNCRQILDEATA